MKLSVQKFMYGYAVFDMQGRKVSGSFSGIALAEARCFEMQRAQERAARIRKRPCLRCKAPIESEGAHHRMCKGCRAFAGSVDRQMTG